MEVARSPTAPRFIKPNKKTGGINSFEVVWHFLPCPRKKDSNPHVVSLVLTSMALHENFENLPLYSKLYSLQHLCFVRDKSTDLFTY